MGKFITNKGPRSLTHLPTKGFISPFRYPGGKSWFVKTARKWLKQQPFRPKVLVEPFAGGAGVSLAAVNENLVDHSAFSELDPDVAAAWTTMLNGGSKWLTNEIKSFRLSRKKVETLLASTPPSRNQRAFRCIVQNRTARGGVLTEGAGLIREGEDGNGLGSRWYPTTLADRIDVISSLKHRLTFSREDGFKLIRRYLTRKRVVFFVDPPYTKAACRLYRHWKVDHEELFKILSRAKGDVLMTYDDTAEIRTLARKYGFKFKRILMKTTHHARKRELMIAKNFVWSKRPLKKRRAELP